MNTFSHRPGATLLLLCSLLGGLPGDAGANDKPETPAPAVKNVSAASAASASAGDTATPGSTVAASAPVNGTPSGAGASSAASAVTGTAHPAANKHAGVNLGSSTPTSGISSLFQVMSALILVVIIMLGLAWGLKNFGPKRLLGRVPVQVVGAANLGGRERVLVIEVADQWIVIGATPNSITTLATLPRQSLNDEELQPGKPFSDWLKQIMEKRNG